MKGSYHRRLRPLAGTQLKFFLSQTQWKAVTEAASVIRDERHYHHRLVASDAPLGQTPRKSGQEPAGLASQGFTSQRHCLTSARPARWPKTGEAMRQPIHLAVPVAIGRPSRVSSAPDQEPLIDDSYDSSLQLPHTVRIRPSRA